MERELRGRAVAEGVRSRCREQGGRREGEAGVFFCLLPSSLSVKVAPCVPLCIVNGWLGAWANPGLESLRCRLRLADWFTVSRGRSSCVRRTVETNGSLQHIQASVAA